MNILVVGSIVKDVYLNLNNRTENFETDKHGTKWLDLSFDASKHYFFHRATNFGGAAVSLEVLQKLGLDAKISGSDLNFADENLFNDYPDVVSAHRYILVSDGKATYFSPSTLAPTSFVAPIASVDYLYIDRSARLTDEAVNQILIFLNSSKSTKLVLYVHDFLDNNLNSLIPRADLIFAEEPAILDALRIPATSVGNSSAILDALASSSIPDLPTLDPAKLITLSDKHLSYLDITESLSQNRVDIMTHLSVYSIAAATILGCFVLGFSVEDSLKLAQINVENSKINTSLSLDKLREIAKSGSPSDNLELIAASLLVPGKGILAADESGGSIHKKFAQLDIPDTYDNRRDYRNLFFTTEDLGDYASGVILFDETARQFADNGQNFVDFLTSLRIVPGIKVDEGLEKFEDSEETFTKGLDHLESRLKEYYEMGLRFAKWRSAFEIRKDENGNIITPTPHAISENCQALADYAYLCQQAGIVPIVEPEVVHDGNYSINECADVTAKILDELSSRLISRGVNLKACIIKTNMVLAGKQFETQSTPYEVGRATAKVLKEHVPENIAGVVFLSGGQTPEQATDNLAEVIKNGPFPWPVTFSFARALQDPALYAWAGDNANSDLARSAFKDRLIANAEAVKH